MTQSVFLGLAGLAIGAAMVTGLALLLDPVAVDGVPPSALRTPVDKASTHSQASIPVPAAKPEPVQMADVAQPSVAQPSVAAAAIADTALDVTPRLPAAAPTPAPAPRVRAALPPVEERPPVVIASVPPPDPPATLPSALSSNATGQTTRQPDRTADAPAWRRYAAIAPEPEGRPRIVIVLDDMGLSEFRSDRAVALPRPLTMAILPYGPEPGSLVARARAAGHEVLVHLPMEPRSGDKDPGPNALVTGLPVEELDRRIAHNLDRMSGYVGINNHMGSRFTASAPDMNRLMTALHARGLLFLDSLTTGASVGQSMAIRHGVPTASRDIFLDNSREPRAIARQLAKVEAAARERGYAIAIGHPYPETLNALSRWLPRLKAKGFELAPISAVVADRPTG